MPVKRHLPLITTRIAFTTQVLPDRPVITPRIDFDTEERRRLTHSVAVENHLSLNDLTSEDMSTTDDEGEDFESEEDCKNELNNELTKIPKPPGEAGRPGSGGYNLKDALGWSKQDYDKVQVSLLVYAMKQTSSPS